MIIWSFVYFVFLTVWMNDITTALMFDIAHIGPDNHNKDILTEGVGTYISTDGIQLARQWPSVEFDQSQDIAGRATYAKLLHLWDRVTGQLADFTTHFTFAISADGAAEYGDGLSFFFARNTSLVTTSGSMGLPVTVNSSSKHMMTSSPFVAVEFDTSWNKDWDPVDSSAMPIPHHVGIDINSLLSSKTAIWDNFTYSKECAVEIKYNSTSQNFSVTVTDYHNNTIIPNQFELHYTVDFRKELPEWVIFGFSASSSGRNFQKNSVMSWSFNSSDLYVDQVRWRDDRKKMKRRKIITYSVVSLIAIVVGVFVSVCVYFWNKKTATVRKDIELNFESNDLPRAFPFKEMLRATNNFHEENKLGEGGFGAVYKGVLQNGLLVAVKKVSTTSKQGIKEYKAEVEIISKARHRNLVKLVGWCHERDGELLLVYELMENRSLDCHLFNSRFMPLPWNVRYDIARGLATALRYLHDECAQCILHRDIKSSNVMLDTEYKPKLGDFGLAKLVDHDKSQETTILAGTPGYLAPECLSRGKVSRQSDVYSYGVVALEIATGRKSVDPNAQDNQRLLVYWVRELYRMECIFKAVDPKLGDQYHKNQMKGLITLGLWCVHPNPDERPSIDKVVRLLNNEDDPLSDLSQEMPTLVNHYKPLPLESVLQNSHPSIGPTANTNESNPNDRLALGSGGLIPSLRLGLNSVLQYVWHQLDIE